MKIKRLLAVLIARNKEFMRDRAALSWNILFPVFIIAGFAFTFSGKPVDLYKVGVYGNMNEARQVDKAFFSTRYIQFIPQEDLTRAIDKVDRHQIDMLFDVKNRRYWINETSPRGYILERVLRGSSPLDYEKQTVSGKEIRYVDWLIPGVLGMNMMFSALFGIGYVIVRYRKNGVLKRLKATPLTAFEFLTAQIISRLWLIMLVTIFVYFGTDYFIGFAMHGDYLDLFVVYALGAFSMISLGLLIAARLASEELAGGLLNFISWPMMFLSGVWFSLEGTNPLVQKLAQIFPLTHITDAARAIMIDGAGLLDIAPQLLILTGMSLVFLLLGSLLFRWE